MAKLKEDRLLLFDQMPLLRIDGLDLVQERSIVRYLAEKHDLRGSTLAEVALCDMLAEGLRDWKDAFGRVFEFAYGAHEQRVPAVSRRRRAGKGGPGTRGRVSGATSSGRSRVRP